MSLPSLKELLEAGVHFGHETRRWNPKMATNIFAAKEKIHIIDLEKTDAALKVATDFVRKIGENSGEIVFLATKKQASEIVKNEAIRVGAMYLTTRWVGGIFTNFEAVNKTIGKLAQLEEKSKDERYTKREQLLMTREIDKMTRSVGGVRNMQRLPDAIFIVDSHKEENAVREAQKVGVKIVAIVDTNGDPTQVDFAVPGNDDAIRAITILVKTIADSYLEGKEKAEKKVAKVTAEGEPVTETPKEETAQEKPKKTVKAAKAETKATAKPKKTPAKKTTNPPAGGKKETA